MLRLGSLHAPAMGPSCSGSTVAQRAGGCVTHALKTSAFAARLRTRASRHASDCASHAAAGCVDAVAASRKHGMGRRHASFVCHAAHDTPGSPTGSASSTRLTPISAASVDAANTSSSHEQQPAGTPGMAPPCDAAPTTVVATPGQRKVEFVCFDDGVFTVKGRMDLAARPALLYELLTDYECAPRVFGNVKSVQVHERVPGEAMRVTQTCKWAFTVFSGTFDCEFAVTEDEASRGLRFTQLSSSFMKSFEGRWHVEPAVLAGSSSSSSGAAATAAPSADAACRVEYVMSVRPNVDVPPQISEYVNGIFTQQVSCIFDDLEAEVKARVAARS